MWRDVVVVRDRRGHLPRWTGRRGREVKYRDRDGVELVFESGVDALEHLHLEGVAAILVGGVD